MKKRLIFQIMTFSILVGILLGVLPAADSQEVEGPRWGGTLVLDLQYSIGSLNPTYKYHTGTSRVASVGPFNTLFYTDVKTNELLMIGLVESYEVTPDIKTYILNLFQNVTFHDGHKCTSADVVWTLEQVMAEMGNGYQYLENVEKIEALDEYTVKITFKEPDITFPMNMGSTDAAYILPKHLYEGTDWSTNPYNEKPVGTGPFKFVEWVRGDRITFEAYDEYHLGRPYVDRVIIKLVPEVATQILRLEKGETHYLFSWPPWSKAIQWGENPEMGVRFRALPCTIPMWLGFNVHREPFTDVKVRRAFAMAINRTDISERVYLGFSPTADGTYVSDVVWAYNTEAKQPDFDPDGAEILLDEAGYTRGEDGVRLRLTLSSFMAMGMDDESIVIKEHLSKIGVEIDIELFDVPAMKEKTNVRHDFDICTGGGRCGPDPNEFARFLVTDGYRNAMNYSNTRIDELFDLGRSVADLDERKEYYYEIQEIIAEDLPRLNLVDYTYLYCGRMEFHGYYFEEGIKLGSWNMQKVWWEEGSLISPAIALESITDAEDEIARLTAEDYDMTEALKKLDDAKEGYDDGDYTLADKLAKEAPTLADAPTPPTPPPYALYTGIVLVVIVAAVLLYQRTKS